MANKHQAHSLKVVTVGHPATPHTFSRRAYHECLILQIVFTPYCLCTTEKYGEPHRNSSLEITLTSSSWIKGAQCNLGSSTCGIWQQRMSNSAWCRNWAGLYSWISWYILHHASKNTNKQFAYPKAFRSISTLGKNTDSSRPCISRMSNKMHWKCCEANQLSMRFHSCAEAYSQEELFTAPGIERTVMQGRDEQRAAGYPDASVWC